MKYHFNGDLVALRKGEYVAPNYEAGEFLVNTANIDTPLTTGDGQRQLNKATIMGIASANKVEVKAGKVAEMQEALFEQLESLELSEISEKPETEKVAEIVNAGVKAGKSDNQILVDIVNAGVEFRRSMKLFSIAMEEGGHRISKKTRDEEVAKYLDDSKFAPTQYNEFAAAVLHCTQHVSDTSEKQAQASIRKWAKAAGVELPEKPKGEKGGFRKKAEAWMIANPQATKKELGKWLASMGKEEKALDRYWRFYDIAQKMAASIAEAAQ